MPGLLIRFDKFCHHCRPPPFVLLCLWGMCSSILSSRWAGAEQRAEDSLAEKDPFLGRRRWSSPGWTDGHTPGKFHGDSPLPHRISLTRGKRGGKGKVSQAQPIYALPDAVKVACSLPDLTEAGTSEDWVGLQRTRRSYNSIPEQSSCIGRPQDSDFSKSNCIYTVFKNHIYGDSSGNYRKDKIVSSSRISK